MRQLIYSILLVTFLTATSQSASISDRVQAAAKQGKYTYVMFYRNNDVATQSMAKTIQSQVAERSDQATWVTVDVNRAAKSSLVKRFDATRIPLPAVFGLAPNGAVTGAYQVKVDRTQLEDAILTPKYSEMVKALQDQKIVVVCLQPAGGGYIPNGTKQFEKSADFRGRTYRVTASAGEASEARFFDRMQVQRDIRTPVTLVFAPPGVHLGTYDATTPGSKIVSDVHASGKCNCKACQQKKKR